ncbi:Uncharacterised protein [uncultured archaeon]|nr:Uncharacterised protein [uncultured archaeon]
MRIYYGHDPRGRSVLYVPGLLFGIERDSFWDDDLDLDFDPENLRIIGSYIKRNKIACQGLSERYWDITSINLPEFHIDKLMKLVHTNLTFANLESLEILDYAKDIAKKIL